MWKVTFHILYLEVPTPVPFKPSIPCIFKDLKMFSKILFCLSYESPLKDRDFLNDSIYTFLSEESPLQGQCLRPEKLSTLLYSIPSSSNYRLKYIPFSNLCLKGSLIYTAFSSIHSSVIYLGHVCCTKADYFSIQLSEN